MTVTSEITTRSAVVLAPAADRANRRLPIGVGLGLGLVASLALWAGLIHLAVSLIG